MVYRAHLSAARRVDTPQDPRVRGRQVFEAAQRMSWPQFFRIYSHALPYDRMVSDMHAAFRGILKDELLHEVYSRWEAPNEINYLDVLEDLRAAGGVYLGVATEPVNFTYIAKVLPRMAILIDINPAVSRVHIPLKGALLEIAETRLEFLSLVLGRPLPGRDIPELESPEDYFRFFNSIPYDPVFRERTWQMIAGRLGPEVREEAYKIWMDNFGIKPEDGISSADILLGKYLYWNMGVKDKQGKHAAWLASEEDYVYIRDMWSEGRIKGVTGDISGEAMKKLSALISQMGEKVSCMYISNCEDPLRINGGMERFKGMIENLPWRFGGFGAQIVRYDMGNGEGKCFSMEKVGLGTFAENALLGLPEAVMPQSYSPLPI